MKTIAARILDNLNIPYVIKVYPVDDDFSAEHVAKVANLDLNIIFKTLVARTNNSNVIMAVINGADSLNLKALANVCSSKSVDLVAVKELVSLTGYVRGGCSPLGAKKNYPVYIDERALSLDKISISAGRRGMQIILSPQDLIKATNATVAKIT